MLIFKNNIYDPKEFSAAGHIKSGDPDYDECFVPRHFLETALAEEEETTSFIGKQPPEFWEEDTLKFYPRAYKIGGLPILRDLLKILKKGLDDPTVWYKMNTYHFCFLFDVLARHSFNYNHDSLEERLNTLPELKGKLLKFELFVKNYFFNTVFLLDEEKYNSLSRQEKLDRGFDCPCQFGAINGLTPTREEMELKTSRDYPYSIFV